MSSIPDIWERLEQGLAKAPVQPAVQATNKDDGESIRDLWPKFRRRLRWLDLAITVIWIFALTKIFVIDIDRKALDAIGHGAPALLDYRIFFYIALLIVVVVFLRKWTFLLAAYIFFFPLLIVVWKIPGFFVRRKSFLLAMAALQGTINFISGFRYNVIAKGLAAFAVLFILATKSPILIGASAIYLFSLILWSYVRLFIRTFSSSTFLDAQRKAINRLLKSERLAALTTLGEEYQNPDLEPYDYNTANQLAIKISTGVAIDRGLYIWAYQLDRYRRQVSPALLFNGLSFAWLFLGTIVTFSLINDALLKIDPHQFATNLGHPSLLAITLYSFASLLLQEAGGIHAVGNAAQVVQLIAALLGLVVVAGFVLNAIVTARRERAEGELRELISTLRSRAQDLERRFRAEYSVTVDEAYNRLMELRAGLAFIFTYLTAAIPEDFLKLDDDWYPEGDRRT